MCSVISFVLCFSFLERSRLFELENFRSAVADCECWRSVEAREEYMRLKVGVVDFAILHCCCCLDFCFVFSFSGVRLGRNAALSVSWSERKRLMWSSNFGVVWRIDAGVFLWYHFIFWGTTSMLPLPVCAVVRKEKNYCTERDVRNLGIRNLVVEYNCASKCKRTAQWRTYGREEGAVNWMHL